MGELGALNPNDLTALAAAVVGAFCLGAIAGILFRLACERFRDRREGLIRHRWRCANCEKVHRWSWEPEDFLDGEVWLQCQRCTRETLATWEGDHWHLIRMRDRRPAFLGIVER